ncbi:MAG: BtrH N-terminal domain-containing protein [Myxococcaceae bacterium]|jgi:hypothetical protein|nr:BtrH N-terminal domain-containing protein [Myxococcaceae bacterium]
MATRAFPWKTVLIVSGLLLLAGLIGGYLVVMRGAVQAYYGAEYRAEPLPAAMLGTPPPTFRLTDVPWFSERLDHGASSSLRMLAAQQGRLVPRATIDFLTGITWGARPIPRRSGFLPGQDVEAGLLRAAPLLGFTRRFVTTDSADDFVRAVKTAIAGGRAVRLALDRAMLLEQRGLVPHSVVVVGYDEAHFEYYEPWCDDDARCTPAERPAGHPGLSVPTARLLLAVESLSLAMQYPWVYQFVVLEPAGAPAIDLSTLLAINGRGLIGQRTAGPSVGSVAVEDTAKALERHGNDVVTPELSGGVALAAAVRRDDAEALVTLFPARPELAKASEALDEAARQYAKAHQALQAKALEQATAALKEAAKADLTAGRVLLDAADAGAHSLGGRVAPPW